MHMPPTHKKKLSKLVPDQVITHVPVVLKPETGTKGQHMVSCKYRHSESYTKGPGVLHTPRHLLSTLIS